MNTTYKVVHALGMPARMLSLMGCVINKNVKTTGSEAVRAVGRLAKAQQEGRQA